MQSHRSAIPYTPICLAKAVKNATEIQGMKMAHVSQTDYRYSRNNQLFVLLITILITDQRRCGSVWTFCLAGERGIVVYYFIYRRCIQERFSDMCLVENISLIYCQLSLSFKQIPKGTVTEISAADKAEELRRWVKRAAFGLQKVLNTILSLNLYVILEKNCSIIIVMLWFALNFKG